MIHVCGARLCGLKDALEVGFDGDADGSSSSTERNGPEEISNGRRVFGALDLVSDDSPEREQALPDVDHVLCTLLGLGANREIHECLIAMLSELKECRFSSLRDASDWVVASVLEL